MITLAKDATEMEDTITMFLGKHLEVISPKQLKDYPICTLVLDPHLFIPTTFACDVSRRDIPMS